MLRTLNRSFLFVLSEVQRHSHLKVTGIFYKETELHPYGFGFNSVPVLKTKQYPVRERVHQDKLKQTRNFGSVQYG